MWNCCRAPDSGSSVSPGRCDLKQVQQVQQSNSPSERKKMASFIRRKGNQTRGGGGGGDGRKRLSTVEEGDEALELAKLEALDQDVHRLEEKIESVKARIADIEAKIERLEETDGASFDDLNAFLKKKYGSATAYYDSLERERDRLSRNMDALRYEKGSSVSERGAQRGVVSEVRSRKIENKCYKVCGTLNDSKNAKGLRRFVYFTAANNAGFAEVTEDTDVPPHRRAIRYEGDNPPMDLTFEIIFTSVRDAAMFCNEILSNSLGYNNDNVDLISPEVVYVDNIQSIYSTDYHSDDEPGSARCGDSDSTVYTAVEPDSDLAMFQSIEASFFLRRGRRIVHT